MKMNLKLWYSYIKKILGFDKDDDVFDNPYCIL